MLLIIGAAALRLWGLTREALWFDEIWHVELSNGHGSEFAAIPIDQFIPRQENYVALSEARAWHSIPRHMEYVLHPPLYHLLLRGWREVVGDSPLRLRGFSVIASVLGVGLIFEAGRRTGGVAVGMWAATMLALSMTQIEQAQDGRGYTLLCAIGLATAMVANTLRVQRSSMRSEVLRCAVVATGAVMMMFTHYFAARGMSGAGRFCAAGAARANAMDPADDADSCGCILAPAMGANLA